MMINRPVLRYPGGKYSIAKWVIAHFPAHETYVELFGGAASILMRKPRAQGEVYNDIVDSDVVNLFRVLRDPGKAAELIRRLDLTPFAYDEYKAAFDHTDDTVERARRMIFRSFAGIGSDSVHRPNAGFRCLKNKQSGVTAANEWSRYPVEVARFVDRLRGVSIENRDALRLLDVYDRQNTLFYADPPYLMSTRSSASVMYSHEYSEADHARLSEKLHEIKGMAIVSGYASDLYDELYGDWKRVERKAKAQNGLPRVECMWLSPNIRTTLF